MTRSGWVDFQEVKDQVAISAVLGEYGVKLEGKGHNLRGQCPLHDGEKGGRSFSVNTSKGLFFCFSCKKGGNVLDLVSELDGLSIRNAALKLQATFLIGESEAAPADEPEKKESAAEPEEPKEKPAEEKQVEEVNPPLGFSLQIDPKHEYGESRGLSSSAVSYLEAGFCLSGGMFAGRFVFPLHDERGELVGYGGRSVDDEVTPKYLFPKGLKKRYLLYNFHREVADLAEEVVLVEGFFALARLKEQGFPLCGSAGVEDDGRAGVFPGKLLQEGCGLSRR